MSAIKLNNVREWLNGKRDYDAGVILYQNYGQLIHSTDLWVVLKNSLPKNKDEKKLYSFIIAIYGKLKTEEPVAHQEDSIIPRQVPLPSKKVAQVAAAPKASTDLEAEIEWREKKWKSIFKEFSLMHQEGLDMPDEETNETNKLVNDKMKLWGQIVELQEEIKYIDANGELQPAKMLPVQQSKSLLPESEVEKMKLHKSIKDTISKARGRLADNEALFAEERDRNKLKLLAGKISKQKERLTELELQREELRKYFSK